MLTFSRRRVSLQLFQHQIRTSNRSNITTATAVLPPEQQELYNQLLVQINGLGTKYKDSNALIERVPIDSLLKAAIKQFHDSRPTIEVTEFPLINVTNKLAINNILATLIYIKSADRLKALMEFTKTDMLLANQIGTFKLLSACKMFEQKLPRLKMEDEFIQYFTPWMLCFPPRARFFHARKVAGELSDLFSEEKCLQIVKAQIKALHTELDLLSKKGIAVDYTSVGDLALGGFMLFKAKFNENSACAFLEDLRSEGVIDAKHISRHAYLYAVGGCFETPGGRYKMGVKMEIRPTSKEGLQTLFQLFGGNTPKAIALRELFISTILSKQGDQNSFDENKEKLDLAIHYYLKIEKLGFLLGTRTHNFIIQVYIKKSQFSMALGVLDRIDEEQRKVVSGVMKIDYSDIDSEEKIEEISKTEKSRENQYPYYDPTDVTDPQITGPPISFGLNLHSFIPIQMSPFLRLKPKHNTAAGSFFSYKPNKNLYTTKDMDPLDVCRVANRLIRRMQYARVVPDALFITRMVEIGRVASDIELIMSSVKLAYEHFITTPQIRTGEIIQPPTSLPEIESMRAYRHDRFSEKLVVKTPTKTLNTPVLNLTVTNRPKPPKFLQVEDMTEIYHVAIDAARLMKRHKACLLLLENSVESKITPGNATLKNAMKVC
jgi:hypothetical protein